MDNQTDIFHQDMSDETVLSRLKSGDQQAFHELIRTYNQRLFRIARAILREDMEAEDIVQEAYIKAFTHLDSFTKKNGLEAHGLGAWLARITTNLAIDRTRKVKRSQKLVDDLLHSAPDLMDPSPSSTTANNMTPERQAAMSQIRALLEREIDNLPDGFREVFILRVVEELSIDETSNILQVPPATIKTRLHRARAKLQASIKTQISSASLQVFPFAGARCDRITENTLARLKQQGITSS